MYGRLAYRLGPGTRLAAVPPGGGRHVHPHPELPQLARRDGGGRSGQRVDAAGRLRERNGVADRRRAGEQGDQPIDPERDPAVRRGAEGERLEQEPEALAGLLRADPERVEHLSLDLRGVNPDRAAAELPAVEDDVVRTAPPTARVAVEVAGGCRERVVQRVPAPLLVVPLEHRKVDHPEDVVAAPPNLCD